MLGVLSGLWQSGRLVKRNMSFFKIARSFGTNSLHSRRNPFVLLARLRQAGPIRDRSTKRLKNKQQKEAFDLLQS